MFECEVREFSSFYPTSTRTTLSEVLEQQLTRSNTGTVCSDGRTPASCGGSAAGVGPTYMIYSDSPYGPWSEPQKLFSEQQGINMDTNLAPVILKNGSLVGIGRTGGTSSSL